MLVISLISMRRLELLAAEIGEDAAAMAPRVSRQPASRPIREFVLKNVRFMFVRIL
jgi:hypothetical protein